MAFDRTNAADLLALKTEVTTDPITMGYTTNTQQILKLLNDPTANVGGQTTADKLTPEKLIQVLDIAEYDSQQVGQGERDLIKMVMDVGIHLDVDIDQYKAKIQEAFPVNGATNTAINALVRPLSRAEVLFGSDTVIVKEDYYAARDS